VNKKTIKIPDAKYLRLLPRAGTIGRWMEGSLKKMLEKEHIGATNLKANNSFPKGVGSSGNTGIHQLHLLCLPSCF
jgi:hypothetical protein